jgi:hypothetical protein
VNALSGVLFLIVWIIRIFTFIFSKAAVQRIVHI